MTTEPTLEELKQALGDARARYVITRDERNELVIINSQLQQQLAEANNPKTEEEPTDG